MAARIWTFLGTMAIALAIAISATGCSSKSAPVEAKGRLVVALTIDWEGAYLSPEGLDAVDAVRKTFGDAAPLTHFVSAGYYTKPEIDPLLQKTFTEMFRKGDEVAIHLHAWKSLAIASGLEPKLAPSFLTGTDKLLEFEDDVGFDVDLDAYNVTELRTLLRKSRELLGQAGFPISKSFRAAGYLGTPKVLQAIREEGFVVDSSAADYRQLEERKDELLPKRVQQIWPKVESSSRPWLVDAGGGQLLEMPIAAFADYSTAPEMIAVLEAAHAQLVKDPKRDVFVVLGFHQETCADFGPRLGEAIASIMGRKEIADRVVFATLENAATMARTGLAKK